MDSGAEERSRLRLHVRAAREWLGRAEESLGRAEDVRGDLNLMLARAELIRARETESPKASVVWMRKLAPLSVALLLAGSGYWIWNAGNGTAAVQNMPPPLPVAEQRTEPLPPPKPEEAAIPAPVQEAAADTAEIAEAAEISVPESEPEPVVPEPETQAAAEEGTKEEPRLARLPSEDMQRLMNSAGQSLRAIE